MIDNYTLCDEEKNFYDWLAKVIVKDCDIVLVKKAFMDGYACGWKNKQIHKAAEQLQK
jgi:hypothetical protein